MDCIDSLSVVINFSRLIDFLVVVVVFSFFFFFYLGKEVTSSIKQNQA